MIFVNRDVFENHFHYDEKKFSFSNEKRFAVKKFKKSFIRFSQQNNESKKCFVFEMCLM